MNRRQRRKPGVRDLGLATLGDQELLDFAAREKWIVVSHDVNSLTEAAFDRLAVGLPMRGLFLAHQRTPVFAVIENLLLI